MDTTLSKTDYEHMILHGAAQIMRMKTQLVKVGGSEAGADNGHELEKLPEIDIEQLISEGEKRHHELKAKADDAVNEKAHLFDFKHE